MTIRHLRSARLAALAVALVALALPSAAAAHARLQSTVPAAGASLDRAPHAITLRFDEPVETAFGALRVVDARGRRVDNGRVTRPGGRASQLTIGLRRGLGKGSYTVAYRVISDEGHPVSNAYVFGVGVAAGGPAASLARLDAGPVTQRAYELTRTAGYLAMAAGLGTLLFLLLCWLPALRDVAGPEPRWRDAADALADRWRALWRGSVALGAAGAVAGLVLQGATAAGTSVVAALDPAVLGEVVDTRAGRGWLARLIAWGAVAGAVELASRRHQAVPRIRRVALGADGYAVAAPTPRATGAITAAAVALAITPGLAGHAATQTPALALPLSAVHVAAMCLWLGGLVAIVALLPAAGRLLEPQERAQLLAATVSRFSPVALAAVVALAATGVAQAALHVHDLSALASTAFGRAVALKAIFLLVLIGFGALNRQRLLPRLRARAADGRAPAGATRALRSSVRGEIALLVAVLTATGALVGYAPPAAQSHSGPVEREASSTNINFNIGVSPARAGLNEIDVYGFGTLDGLPYRDLHHVTVIATRRGATSEPIALDARRVTKGHYVVPTAPLTTRGTWTLRITNRMPRMRPETATVDVPVR